MARFGISQPVRRVEDERLLRGQGSYIDDIDLPGQARAYFLRSPHAHANVVRIDVARAAAAPGVVAVLTGEEYRDAGYGQLFSEKLYLDTPILNKDGTPRADPGRWPLAIGRVRHVGDAVAMVIAETATQALDAAEMIEVDYEALPAVTGVTAAQAAGAPLVWDDVPGNLCFHWQLGNEAAKDAAFARAARVTELDLVNNRMVANPIEPRGALASYGDDGLFTLHLGTQNVHMIRDVLCDQIMDVPRANMRVVTRDVGGGFGTKYYMYPEYPLCLWAAKKLGRPIKWTPDRAESFLTDVHARDHVTHAALATDDGGRFLGLHVLKNCNMGAYLSTYAAFIPTMDGAALLAGAYDNPAIYVEVRAVFTHTVPVDAFRGSGRPEANYTVERIIDHAARELGLDPIELRRRNLIPPDKIPYKTALRDTYDSGEFERNMDDALARADHAGFAARRTESSNRGRFRGIGLAYYMEATEGLPEDSATIEVGVDGRVTVLTGTQDTGQGHRTTFAQIVADYLEVPFESIAIVQGDTDRIAEGPGTGGSRSIIFGGAAMADAAKKVIEKGRAVAAEVLEAAAADIAYAEGQFTIRGTDRRVGLFEVAAQAVKDGGDLAAGGHFKPEVSRSFPNGCHVCEVEVDPETGALDIVRHTVVDDFGKVINPLLVAGQVHGGTLAGIGQALCEYTVFDDAGQLVTGSYMDYCMPRADDVPSFDFSYNEILCRTNPLGVKGCGEAGTMGGLPSVVNATLDALAPLGVTDLEMPLTPHRVWQTIQAAKAA